MSTPTITISENNATIEIEGATVTAPGLFDSSLFVHIAGTETITGAKTFSALLTIAALTASGAITANAGISVPTGQNITGAGTAQVTGFATVSATSLAGTLSTAAQPNVTSLGTLAGLTVTAAPTFSALTSGRIPYATTAGLLTDSADLTFDGTDFKIFTTAFTVNKTTGNTVVNGDLTVNGTTTTVSSSVISVTDPLIKLAKDNVLDVSDLGWYAKYQPAATPLYAGLFRDASDGKLKLFSALQEEPTTTVNILGTGYTVATLVANLEGSTGVLTASLTSPVLIGGTAVGSALTLQSTSAVGTTDHIKFLVGNNGATEAMRIINSGSIQASSGSVGGPSYSFLSATNCGLYWDGNNLAFSFAGARRAYINATTSEFNNKVLAEAFIPTSATVPTNGMYLSAANTLAWATNSAFGASLTNGIFNVQSELRLAGQSYSRVAVAKLGGGWYGGYNLTLVADAPVHDSNGAVSGIGFHSTGISFFCEGSQLAGVGAAERMSLTQSGNLLIGTVTETASAGLIQLATGTTAAYGIVAGTDTNLYRSSPNAWTTDDNFIVGATLYIGAGGTQQFSAAAGVSGAVDLVASGSSNPVYRICSGAATSDIRFLHGGTGGPFSLVLSGVASAVNYLAITNSATGGGVTIGAAGTDTNINIALTPKGTGTLKFGTYTAKGAEAFDGFITITDAGGNARKLMTCA